MTVREDAQQQHERIFCVVLELDLDTCMNTYGVAPCTAAGAAGTECYNTFSTCQDKANFTRGTMTYKFCNRGMRIPPGELIRPYIVDINFAATEVDPKAGLARSSKTTIRLVDEDHTDYEADPYFATRATPAAGTVLNRLLARNPNYSGRWARLRYGYEVTPWDWDTFQTELYVIDSIKVGADGTYSVTLKDPIKFADRTKVPAPTDGKLLSAIAANALSLDVGSDKSSQYGSSGYVRVKDEVIRFTSNTSGVLAWPDTTYRGQFGTTAAAYNADDAVQLCKVYTSTALTDVIIDLLNASGIDNAYIDTAGFAYENTRWLSQHTITVCLTEPESPSVYISELCRDANAMVWWHPVDQMFRFKVNMPEPLTVDIPLFKEDANIIENSISVDVLEAERLTYAAVRYRLVTPVANRTEDKNYLESEIFIDGDAEDDKEYGDRRAEVIRSRFLSSANQIAAVVLASRTVNWRRDAPAKVKFRLDPKDYTSDAEVGSLVDIDTRKIVDASGNNKVTRVRIVKAIDHGTHIEVEARTTKFRNRYGFIAPNGTPDYPTDTDHAHICRSTPSQTMTNGDDPYLII